MQLTRYRIFVPMQMRLGPIAQRPIGLLLDGACSWVTLLYFENIRSSRQFWNRPRRWNTGPCHRQVVKSSGCNVFFENLVFLFLDWLHCLLTTLVLCYQPCLSWTNKAHRSWLSFHSWTSWCCISSSSPHCFSLSTSIPLYKRNDKILAWLACLQIDAPTTFASI